jgi:hypothetical protein
VVRRSLVLLLVGSLLLAAAVHGGALPEDKACDYASMAAGDSGGCGDAGTSLTRCITHCDAGACIAATGATLQAGATAAPVRAHPPVALRERSSPPDTAPPKA